MLNTFCMMANPRKGACRLCVTYALTDGTIESCSEKKVFVRYGVGDFEQTEWRNQGDYLEVKFRDFSTLFCQITVLRNKSSP